MTKNKIKKSISLIAVSAATALSYVDYTVNICVCRSAAGTD